MAASLEFHPASMIFPMMEDSELDGLVEDIRNRGLDEPIVLHEGKVLDGRNRLTACRMAGKEPRFTDFKGDDPAAFVISKNLHRRHLTASQRAAVATDIISYYENAAAERRARAPHKDSSLGPVGHNESGKSSDRVGVALGIGGRTVRRASLVKKEAEPEVFQAVRDGTLTVHAAEKIAALPRDQQVDAITNPPSKQQNEPDEPEEPNGKSRGKGVRYGNEAVDCLKRIPKNDPLRKRGFQIVTDWIRQNR